MRVPVLAYHGVNVTGNAYAENDHAAFAADLRLIDDLGLRIVPLQWAVDTLLGSTEHDLDRAVALSCDDGSDLDYFDLDFPPHGTQRSLFNGLIDFRRERGLAAQPHLHLTAFAIASADARATMDRACLFGRDWMGGRWWRAAQASGLMTIENHSWDHNHAALPEPGPHGMVRGSFHAVDTLERARAEIVAAGRELDLLLAPRRTRLFCYPFGHVGAYLHDEFFPNHADEHGLDAAFGDGAAPITLHSDRWNLPRYICGWHWKSPGELRAILAAAV